MTINAFVAACCSGAFIDYDGIGHVSDGELMYGEIKPSDVVRHEYDNRWANVVWFNR
jgi:hypothetical protein